MMAEMIVENNSILAINPKSIWRQESNGYTIYNPDTDILTNVSSLGKNIVDMFDGKTTIAEIYTLISEIHNDFSSDVGKKEFLAFLDKLVARKIILQIKSN